MTRFTAVEEADKQFFEFAQFMTVGGEIKLPSGVVLPKPPEGKVWIVRGHTVTQEDKTVADAVRAAVKR